MTDSGTWRDRAMEQLSMSQAAPPSRRMFEWPGKFASGSRVFVLDESQHPSSSIKHETMRLVFRRLIADGTIRFGRPVVVASAGNAALATA